MDTANRIFNQAIRNGMPETLAEFITAQAAHETDGFTSDIFQACNNCFGYKWVGQSTALGPCPGHPAYAAYSSVEQSTDEMCKWIKRRVSDGSFPPALTSITTYTQYAALLKNANYFEDTLSNYTAGIGYWLQQLNFTAVAAGGGLLLVAAALVWIFRKRIFRPTT